MSKEQKKFQKKKEREREAHKKVLVRRAALRKPQEEENVQRRKLKRIKKLQDDLGGLNVWADEVFMKMSDKALSQLEKNARILKALEAEYEKESQKKNYLNKDLESKGLKNLKDKLQYLHDQLVEESKAAEAVVVAEKIRQQDEAEFAQTPALLDIFENSHAGFAPAGAAECNFKPKKPKKDVAEISVTKAPVSEEPENS